MNKKKLLSILSVASYIISAICFLVAVIAHNFCINYNDIYDPFWINVATWSGTISYVCLGLGIVLMISKEL